MPFRHGFAEILDHGRPSLTGVTGLSAAFAVIAPPGSANVPVTIAASAFGVTVISAIAASIARETDRAHLNDLGVPGAVAVGKVEYDQLRRQAAAAG